MCGLALSANVDCGMSCSISPSLALQRFMAAKQAARQTFSCSLGEKNACEMQCSGLDLTLDHLQSGDDFTTCKFRVSGSWSFSPVQLVE